LVYDSIIGGGCNNIIASADKSAIISGSTNCLLNSTNSAIIGGCNNRIISGTNSVIIGGLGIIPESTQNTVFVPKLQVVDHIQVLRTATSSVPHISFSGGASPSSLTDGSMWYDGNALYFRTGGTTYQLAP
jgi:hypothetical protein